MTKRLTTTAEEILPLICKLNNSAVLVPPSFTALSLSSSPLLFSDARTFFIMFVCSDQDSSGDANLQVSFGSFCY